MSGYLSRLAVRALGQAPAVHANVSLPFFGTREPLPEVESRSIGVEGRPRIDRDAERSRVTASPRAAGEISPPHALLMPLSEQPLSISPGQSGAKATPKAPQVGLPVPEPRADEAPRPATEVVSDPPLVPIRVVEPGVAPAPATAAQAPLARLAAASPPLATSRAAARRTSERSKPAPEAPPSDVYIHIGRIELTAVSKPAPPRRSPQPAKKPMSLDEYLQRRGGTSP